MSIHRNLSNLSHSIENAQELASEGTLFQHWGSRSLPWRFFLGVLTPQVPDGEEASELETRKLWVRQTKEHRKKFANLQESLSLKAMISKNVMFNPLAPQPKKDEGGYKEKEMKDLIRQDVERTC